MTQEDKNLLLKDLCARLPYGVKMLYSEECPEWFSKIYGKETSRVIFTLSPDILVYIITELDRVKPYLRLITSMTEDEAKEFALLQTNFYIDGFLYPTAAINMMNWLNAHHFDCYGLIEKGLALEAPEGTYKTE